MLRGIRHDDDDDDVDDDDDGSSTKTSLESGQHDVSSNVIPTAATSLSTTTMVPVRAQFDSMTHSNKVYSAYIYRTDLKLTTCFMAYGSARMRRRITFPLTR